MAKAKSEAAGAMHPEPPLDPLAPAEAPGRALVLGDYRGRPQRRTGRASDWTQDKADAFIAVLVESCNVSLAARAIKRSIANVYKQRTLNAEFRGAWDQALAIGYAQLEMMMLERALHGVEKSVVIEGRRDKVMRESPTASR